MGEIGNAINWWLSENCRRDPEVFGHVRGLLQHFFHCADSLYAVLQEAALPEVAGAAGVVSISVGGRYNTCVVNLLSGLDFFRLRGMLALVGDMFCVVRAVRELSDRLDNSNLSSVLDRHQQDLKGYRWARNFFAHLDDRLGAKMGKHGVTGELEIRELGLRFTRDAEECFYLGFAGDTVYFHDRQQGEAKASPKSVSVGKEGMSDVFSLVRDLYDLVTSHSIHAQDYPPSGSVYDLG